MYGVTKEEREGKPDNTFTALPGYSPRKRSERALKRILLAQSQVYTSYL